MDPLLDPNLTIRSDNILTPSTRMPRDRMVSYDHSCSFEGSTLKSATKGKSRVIVVTTYLPVNLSVNGADHNREWTVHADSAKELVLAMYSLRGAFEVVWVGWPANIFDENLNERDRLAIRRLLAPYKMHAAYLTEDGLNMGLKSYCRMILWMNFHNIPNLARTISDTQWQAFVDVNRRYMRAVTGIIKPGDIVWIHGHELSLVPQMLREEIGTKLSISIGYFLHIPFPIDYFFQTIPNNRQILLGMLGADFIGFQTYQFSQNFVRAVYVKLGLKCSINKIEKDERIVTFECLPMGIDYKFFEDKSIANAYDHLQTMQLIPPFAQIADETSTADVDAMLDTTQDERKWKLIVISDRVDKSSDLAFHIHAYKHFLQTNTDVVKSQSVVLLLLVQPPLFNEGCDCELKDEIDNLVSNINGTYNTITWKPILYRYGYLRMNEMRQIFLKADVCMSVPQKSGMGLICKQYIASRTDSGVVILSENMGAANELCADAILVNPCDRKSVSSAIKYALEMPAAEQKRRINAMQDRIRRVSGQKWAEQFVEGTLDANLLSTRSRTRLLAGGQYISIVLQYREAPGPKLIILDYDGTLVELKAKGEDPKPDKELIYILSTLSRRPNTTVVINSGRSKECLESLFGGFSELDDVHIAAEHGIWIRTPEDGWEKMIAEQIDDSWKPELMARLENMYMHVQGVRVEETDHGIAVVVDHSTDYGQLSTSNENQDDISGNERDKEVLRNYLDIVRYHLRANQQLRLIEGNTRVELKSSVLSKGRAALYWIGNGKKGKDWEFIMSVGDDYTDEEMFKDLPDSAIKIKVGLEFTNAKYYVVNMFQVRLLLWQMISEH